MKKPYEITTNEFWALAALVYLPLESGSILSRWLAEFETPVGKEVIEEATNALLKKGYIDPQRGEDFIADKLLESLIVLAVSCVRLTAAIQRDGKFTWTHFGQLEESVVQYQTSENRLLIHPPDTLDTMPAMLVPEWFHVESKDEFSDELPFSAYVMLMTALQLEDQQAVLGEEDAPVSFQHTALVEGIKESQDWLEIYHALEIPGVQSADQTPLDAYLALLEKQEYLQAAGEGMLQLGPRATSFSNAYSDPDLCILTLSIVGTEDDFPPTGSLLYGNGVLLLIELSKDGKFSIRQLQDMQSGLDWAASLLSKGAQVKPVLSPLSEESTDGPQPEADDEVQETGQTLDQGSGQAQPAPKGRGRKRWITCAIILGALALIVVCVLLAMYIYDEIMWTPTRLGVLPFMHGG